mmetsp:Transcript_108646/g.339822  ORF Transcript_108646/g.339822 Transcript_108646/m.339822 type:complete len:155 (-) Transcript_108646:57-521(-)
MRLWCGAWSLEPESLLRLRWSVRANGLGASVQVLHAATGPSRGTARLEPRVGEIANSRVETPREGNDSGTTPGYTTANASSWEVLVPMFPLDALLPGHALDILIIAGAAWHATLAAAAAVLRRTTYVVTGRCIARGAALAAGASRIDPVACSQL